MTTKEWKALIKQLKTRFPVSMPVEVRRCPAKRNAGITSFDGDTYRIRIDSTQDVDGQVDSLLHEWAHMLAIDLSYQHKGMWGVLYAQLHEAWTRDFEKTS